MRKQGDPAGTAFTLMGQNFWAMNGGAHSKLPPAVSITVYFNIQLEVDRFWTALLADGGVENRCGWRTDRFGLSWKIVPRALIRLLETDIVGRVMQAMMAMLKLDIAALEAAAPLTS